MKEKKWRLELQRMKDEEVLDKQVDGMIDYLNAVLRELKTKVAFSKTDHANVQFPVTDLSDEITNLEQILGRSERSMTSRSKSEVVQANINLTKASTTLTDVFQEWAVHMKQRFQLGEIEEPILQKMVGMVQNDQGLSSDLVEMTTAVTSAYAKMKKTVTDVDKTIRIAVSKKKIYIRADKETIKVLDLDGQCIKRIAACRVQDFSRDESGNIYMCNFGGKWISKLSNEDDVVDLFGTNPLYPQSLCFTQSAAILVALVDVVPSDYNKCKQTYIAKMDIQGREKTRYEYEDDGTARLFQYVCYVSENRNKDILVLDKTGRGKSRLYILNDEGRVKHAYNGTSKVTMSFKPVEICCDKYCRILITDLNNDAIHLLNEKGQLLQLLLTKNDGLESPYSIALDDDLPCIGTSEGKVILADYKG